MNWIKENWFKLAFVLFGFIIVSSFAWYMVGMPIIREDRIKAEDERKELIRLEDKKKVEDIARDSEISRSACLEAAEDEYQATFELNSRPIAGQDARTWDSASIKDDVERKLQQEKDNCVQLFPIK